MQKSIIIRYIICLLFENKNENEIQKRIGIRLNIKLYPNTILLREYNATNTKDDFMTIDMHIKNTIFKMKFNFILNFDFTM